MKTIPQTRDRVDSIIDRWRNSGSPNARRILDAFPEIAQEKSLALDLVYEEFCLRQEAGELLDTKEFCGKFPTLKHSLARMLDVHRYLRSQSLGLPAADPANWPEPGNPWLDWLLIKEIGRGAFSRVFLAEEPALGNRQVVVKCSKAGPREAFLLGQLDHPNIVPVFSIRTDEESGLTGICMPFLGTTTLANVLDDVTSGPLFPQFPAAARHFSNVLQSQNSAATIEISAPDGYVEAVVLLVEQLLLGLEAAEQAGVIHGDIKPSNIILTASGRGMLVDFNLSIDTVTGEGRLGGTPPYMAPELLSRLVSMEEPAKLERPFHSDLFSVGAVLFELLYGRTPFELDFADGVPVYRDMRKVAVGPTATTIDARLRAIVDRCVEMDPRERFGSFTQLAWSLKSWRAQSEVRSQRRRVVLAAALSLVGITATVAGASVYRRVTTPTGNQKRLLDAIENIDSGDYETSAKQLGLLFKSHRHPLLAAWAAFCWASFDQHEKAIFWNGLTLEHDDSDPHIWSNRGYCNYRLGRLPAAEADYSAAIARQPDLQAALHGRALVKLRKAMVNRVAPTEDAFVDLRDALAAGPESALLHFDAAIIIGHAWKHDAASQEAVEQHIIRSLELGESIATFKKARSMFKDIDLDALDQRADRRGETRLSSPLLLEPADSLINEFEMLSGD